MDIFQALTIINSIVLAILPLAFFRRQKLNEIKYKEIMELNIKTHDITKRAEKSMKYRTLYDKDFDRLDYLISRFKKHSIILSNEIQEYKKLWELVTRKEKGKKLSKKSTDEMIVKITKKGEVIRDLADKLLN